MHIPDPFKIFTGGVLHRIDIGIAESISGVKGWSISRHMAEPGVRFGMTPNNAVAAVHWLLIAAGVVGVATYKLTNRDS